ncbi:MAG TPA: glycoside hydrolase family 3 C-terminal domain-containing protein [Gemmatimonadales bacterium]|nr:glycoside hydrolase family 3 C-terminal domain-containing protein [Gemmatimonadales bacterium]
MRLLKKVLKVLAALVLAAVAAAAFLLWWTYPKRTVIGPFVRQAGPGVFRFTDVPKGRALRPEEVDGYARRLMAGMTLEEKVLQMSGDTSLWELLRLVTVERGKYNDRPITAGADRRLGIPPIGFSDGPRGVAMNHSTCFPVAMARAASWDRGLQRRVGDVVGREIRAQGGNLWGGLCVNLLRHPSWGRAQETLGEDPYLVGEMALPEMEAVQAHNVMGCAKHYALNSIEETRTKVDVHVDERTLHEVYLPHFRRLAEAEVAAFMSAYNKVNGDYCGESRHLLRDILKQEWGYRGFVMSDFFEGVHDGRKAALAGLDLEMPWTSAYGSTLLEAVRRGEVPAAPVEEAVLRLLRRKIDYATRPDPTAYPPTLVHAAEHVALARETAERSAVLLKNDGLLPLDAKALAQVAIFGRLAGAPNLGDYGSSRVYPPANATVVQGLTDLLGPGHVGFDPAADGVRATAVARAADVAIVVAGFDQSDEGEYIPENPDKAAQGGDREDLALKPADRALIEAVAAGNPRTIVLLIGGSAITVEEWQERARAIVMAFYPGEQGGAALARLLFGAASFSAKLPFTVPRNASQLPPFDNRSPSVQYDYYHGYTLLEKKGQEPRYPFGYGLGYTRYAYANLALSPARVREDGTVTASVDVTNTGGRAGEEVVELYVGFPNAKVDRPVKLLRGFDRVALAPGETRRISLGLRARDLAWYDAPARTWRVEHVPHTVLVGGSSRPADLLAARLDVVE